MNQITYCGERESYLVKLNGSSLGGVESYRLRVERKCYRAQSVAAKNGSLVCTPPSYTITLSRFLPDRIQMPRTLGALLDSGFKLSILHKNRTDEFTGCRVLSATERIDERGRILEEMVCVAQGYIHYNKVSTEV